MFYRVQYFLYVLYSKELETFYAAYSANREKRLRKHNTSNKSYTGKRNHWKILCTEEFSSKAETMHHQKEIKKWKSKKMILQLIENDG